MRTPGDDGVEDLDQVRRRGGVVEDDDGPVAVGPRRGGVGGESRPEGADVVHPASDDLLPQGLRERAHRVTVGTTERQGRRMLPDVVGCVVIGGVTVHD
ncbi:MULTISPECIES: hypothetical protein [Aeromicrobium]|uniref:hypothetical protein n=1 Tax=Aeromicrobium TaxID=2040 RepID=UPI000B08693A|nr:MULTISPECIES: hypothetical protein [Aeromicrobium]